MGAYSGPELVDDGLVLALDAANTRSYGGIGTTWTDVSYRGNNGTLTNGPVFTQEPSLEPFGGAGAVSFDGTGDYLNISSHSDHDLGSGDFTVEGWFKTSATIAYQTIIQKYYGPANYNGWNILLDSAGTRLQAAVFNGSNIEVDLFGGSNLNDGNWHHFALARSGTDLRLFVDGTLTDSSTNSFNITATSDLQIGRHFSDNRHWNGYLSNLRIIKGTALYTSNFTPKRQPLIPESAPNTVLLTCQKGNIRDRSPSAHTITINGDAKSISGASYFDFDGTNDYVDCGTSSDYTFGTGAFTAEMWIYPTVTPSQFDCILIGDNPNLTSVFWGYRSGYLDFVNRGDTYTLIRMTYPTLNQWTHVVISRDSSGYIAAYKNGVVQASSTGNTDNYNQTEMYVGGQGSYTYPGYISNTLIYKGKGLTASEVLQNYQNTKSRYGL